MTTEHEDQELVKRVWEFVRVLPEGEIRLISALGPWFLTWTAAAKYTREALGKVAEIEEEILWVESESSMSDGYPYPEAQRILVRERAALADASRGMKEGVQR